jgi:putative salt-induced outer membrane protein
MKMFKLLVAIAATVAASNVVAQTVIKPDGQWRGALGAGLSIVGGNTSSKLLNINGDAIKATATEKWNIYGSQIYGKTGDATTADLLNLGARFNQDLNAQLFWFGQGDLGRNKLANLSLRTAIAGGLGYHVIKSDPTTFDVFVGLGYANDRYVNATIVADQTRSSYGRMELLIGEESTHKLSASTLFRQRLVIYPNLSDRGEYRAAFDAGLSVAMSGSLSLQTTLGLRMNSDPGTGLKKTDTLFFTGISYKYE